MWRKVVAVSLGVLALAHADLPRSTSPVAMPRSRGLSRSTKPVTVRPSSGSDRRACRTSTSRCRAWGPAVSRGGVAGGSRIVAALRYTAYGRAIVAALRSLRYIAYGSELAEAFRPIVSALTVLALYIMTFSYMISVIFLGGFHALKNGFGALHAAREMAHELVFQTIANLILPTGLVHTLVHCSHDLLFSHFDDAVAKWGPILLGLSVIPFLPRLDPMLEHILGAIFDKIWPASSASKANQYMMEGTAAPGFTTPVESAEKITTFAPVPAIVLSDAFLDANATQDFGSFTRPGKA